MGLHCNAALLHSLFLSLSLSLSLPHSLLLSFFLSLTLHLSLSLSLHPSLSLSLHPSLSPSFSLSLSLSLLLHFSHFSNASRKKLHLHRPFHTATSSITVDRRDCTFSPSPLFHIVCLTSKIL